MKTVNLSGRHTALERTCQLMLSRGLAWLAAHPKHQLEGLRDTAEVQALGECICADINPTDALFAVIMAHLQYIQKYGYAEWLASAPPESVYEYDVPAAIADARARLADVAAQLADLVAKPSSCAAPLSPCGMTSTSASSASSADTYVPDFAKLRVFPKLRVVTTEPSVSKAADASSAPDWAQPQAPHAVKSDLTVSKSRPDCVRSDVCTVCGKAVPLVFGQAWGVCCSHKCRMMFLYGESGKQAEAKLAQRCKDARPAKPKT